MLSRSQRSNLNQENPHLKPSTSSLHPTKTPARQALAGPSKPGLTGGRGLTTKSAGRVLGQKDGNQGKGAKESTLLFPGKSSAPVVGPSCAPSKTLSPPPAPVLPSHLRTPSPGLHKFAPLSFSPEVEPEVEAEPEEQELDLTVDREVEYAGLSSADYDEPFVPDFPLPDFKTAGLGAAFRSFPILPCEDYAEWQRQDEEDRRATKFEMDEMLVREDFIDSLFDSTKPMFPVPKRRPLAAKAVNGSATPRSRPGSVLSNSTNSRRPKMPSSSRVLSTTSQPRQGSLAPPTRPMPATTTTLKPASSTVLSRSLGHSSTVSRVRPGLTAAKSTSAVPSRLSKAPSSALSSVKESAGGSKGSKTASLVGDAEAEKELGIFGIEDEGLGMLDESMEVAEFAFEV